MNIKGEIDMNVLNAGNAPQKIIPAHFGRLSSVFRSKNPQAEEIRTIAKEMSRTVPATGDFTERMRTLLKIQFAIDQTKKGVLGTDAGTVLSNSIMQLVSYYYLGSISVLPDYLSQGQRLYEWAKAGSESDRWFAPKIWLMNYAMESIINARNFASGLSFPQAEKTYDGMRRQISDFDGANSRLISALHELRKYGVKTSWFQDGIMHSPSQAWLMMNPFERKQMHHSPLLRNNLACVILADKADVRKAKVQYDKIVFSDISSIVPVSAGVPGVLSFGITREGELDVAGAFGALPYRKIFQELGKEYEYELFRMANILRLWDLVVPLEISSMAPRLPSTAGFGGGVAASVLSKKRIYDPRLILPRIRLIDTPGLGMQLQHEVDSGTCEAERRTRPEMRKHEVIGHVRKLHQGYNTSVSARMLADEAGITLQDGETYVVAHTRGKGEETGKIHKAVSR